MEKGTCLLDVDAETLPEIAGVVVNALARDNLIRQEDRLPCMNALLLKERMLKFFSILFLHQIFFLQKFFFWEYKKYNFTHR